MLIYAYMRIYVCDLRKNEFSWARKVVYAYSHVSAVWTNDPEDASPDSGFASQKETDEGFRQGYPYISTRGITSPRLAYQYRIAALSVVVVVVVVTGKMRSGSVPKPSCPLIVSSTRGVLRQVSPIFRQCPESYIPSGGPILSLSLFSLSFSLCSPLCASAFSAGSPAGSGWKCSSWYRRTKRVK